jgi:hypothetical protein
MNAVAAYFQRLGTEASAAWDRFWFAPAYPVPLARLRIAIGLIALAYFLSWSADLAGIFAGDGLLPPGPVQELLSQRSPGRPHFHLSPLFSIDSVGGLYVYHAASLLVAILLTCGVFTRVSCLLMLLAVLMHVHRAPMLTSPLETVLVFLLLYLLIGPAGAAYSFDAWRATKGRQLLIAPSWTANISLRLMQVHLAGFIWLVACSMLGSRFWWNGTALWALEAQELSRPLDLSWLRDFPKLVNGWTHLFVLINLLFPILVWNRLLRPLVVALGVIAWLLMIPLTGQVLYVLAVITAMCAFLRPAAPDAQESAALAE